MTMNDSCHIDETIAQIETGAEKPYPACEKLADNVAAQMEAGDTAAEACLQKIAAAYQATGSETVKLALENCFLFRLGNRIFQNPYRQRLLDMLPRLLHDLLMKQMLAPGP